MRTICADRIRACAKHLIAHHGAEHRDARRPLDVVLREEAAGVEIPRANVRIRRARALHLRVPVAGGSDDLRASVDAGRDRAHAANLRRDRRGVAGVSVVTAPCPIRTPPTFAEPADTVSDVRAEARDALLDRRLARRRRAPSSR